MMRSRIVAVNLAVLGVIMLLPTSRVSAQGAAAQGGQATAQPLAPGAPKPPSVTGSGNPGNIPVWTGTTTIGNSQIRDNGGTVTIQSALDVSGSMNVSGSITTHTLNAIDGSGDIAILAGNGGRGVRGQGTAIGVEGIGDTGMVGDGTTYGVHGTGAAGVFGEGSASGVYGLSDRLGVLGQSDAGVGVKGISVWGDAVQGVSFNGRGLYGSTQSATNNAIVGELLSANPSGTTAVIGVCPATQGYCNGIIGITGAVGQGVIGVLNASSTGGDGIHGYAYPTSGSANGVVGETFSPNAAGVIGLNNSAGGQGVRGGTNAAGGIGVLGYNAAGGVAGQFQGDLVVTANAYKPGGGSWSVYSDVRLKKSIHPIDHALHHLLQLRGVSYEYANPTAIGELPGLHLGMVAQEVEQVFPSWIDTGTDGYKRLTFRGFEAVAVEAVRELDMNSKEAFARIADLEHENAELRRAVEALSEAVRTVQQK